MLANNLSAEDEDAVQNELEQLRREAVRPIHILAPDTLLINSPFEAGRDGARASEAYTSTFCSYCGASPAYTGR